MSLRDRLMRSRRDQLSEVSLPEPVGTVYIQPLSAMGMVECEFDRMSGDDPPMSETIPLMQRVCYVCVREADGERSFEGPHDAAFDAIDAETLADLFNACIEKSGLDRVDVDITAIEDHRNSPTDGGLGNSPKSPSPSDGPISTPSLTNSARRTPSSGPRTPPASGPSAPPTRSSCTD